MNDSPTVVERPWVTSTHVPPPVLGHLLGWPGLIAAFLWGFAEATLFFIIPDVLLSLSAIFSIRRSALQMAAVTAGAVVGGAVMYCWSAQGPAATEAVAHVPFIPPAMFEKVERGYADRGPVALIRGPMSGLPYKVYAVLAPRHLSLPVFLVWSVPARLERFAITWALFAAFGLWVRRHRRNWSLAAVGIHGLYWCAVYVIYWGMVVRHA